MKGKDLYKLLMIVTAFSFMFIGIILNDWLSVTFAIWAVAFTLMME